MSDLCLECSTLTLFIMGCSKGLKKICHHCSEAEAYLEEVKKYPNAKI